MKFKIQIFIIIALSGGVFNANAQKPTWSVKAVDYNYSMAYVGVVYLNNEKMADQNSMIAAFVGDEIRGVASPVFDDKTNNWTFYLLCYSNVDNQTLTFKYYSAATGATTTFVKTDTFVADKISGSPFQPYIWASPELSGSELVSFELEGQLRSQIVDNVVNVVPSEDMDITNAIALFEVSKGATVRVDGNIQVSGVTANDFSKKLVYHIQSADGTTEHSYTINVIVNDLSNAEVSTVLSLNGDGVNDTWVVKDVEKFSDATFYILNSYGHKLLESVGYNNTWDGTYDGKQLPTGTYYYIIKVSDENVISGTISIIR